MVPTAFWVFNVTKLFNWKQKLTSRKLWVALVGFITALLVAIKLEEAVIAQVAAVIMAFGTLISYILAEGWIDAKREEGDIIVETTEIVEKE